ncbi:beta-ketoacyl-CoA synthase [Angomonas deanei]|uniref:Elongation of fatty acids protein n=1 Tax=Angomonas deanei TaxID=59799 RepID=A0A7G2CIQ4_9TRYP|nr:beta-ketoacyl-CoA synthase [Angomonas deanei]CAD2219299.1 GNS1/SUR4 family, putative [Angomonas deanei]|eukprot:EPY41575.1 beta-ketoacyl-CoA synthase [Angomonas deanei]
MNVINHYGDTAFDGNKWIQFLTDYADYAIYIAILYLGFVFWAPYYIEKYFIITPGWVRGVKRAWVVWNLLLSIFSLYGTLNISPYFIKNMTTLGPKETLCVRRAEETIKGRIGLCMALFAVSKLPEFGDSFFLILSGKKKLAFLSWFHHVTIFLYSWYAYQQQSSIFIVIAAMNYFVHTVMYLYFALAEAGYGRYIKPFAMYITIIQILQMIGGLTMTSMTMYYKHQAEAAGDYKACEGASWAVCRGQMGIYITNMYLFSEMFLKTYVWKTRDNGSQKKK